MRIQTIFVAVFLLLPVAIVAQEAIAQETIAQEPDYDAIAWTIVTQSAEVQPGEVVLIRGSAESLEIFEALVAQTLLAGGHPIPVVDFLEARFKAMQEAPLEYLLQEQKGELALLEALDVYIDATPSSIPALRAAGIPLERRQAELDGRASYFEAAQSGSHREVYVGQFGGVPVHSFAEFIGADFGEMDGVFWKAIAVTSEELGTKGAQIAEIMTAGAEVRLTGPNGTDLTFTLSNEPVHLNTSRASENEPESGPAIAILPAGEFAACVDPSSANGVVVAPVYSFRFQDVYGLTLVFEDGVVTDMSAESGGEPLREFLDTVDEPSRALSLVNIGLNTESRPFSGSSYRSWEMGGFVTVFLGDNTEYQCGHVADFRLHPHIEGLTLTVDGQPVVTAGIVVE